LIIKAVFASLLVLVFGAICFGIGAFVKGFNENMCYSEVLETLGSGAQAAASNPDPEHFKEWAAFASDLPLFGYESKCEQILAYVKSGAKHE